MSIQEFPDGRIKVRWRVGNRHAAKTFTAALYPSLRERRQAAEAYHRERRREVALGIEPIVDEKKTLRELVHEEFVPVFIATKEPKTQALYRSLWNAHLSPAFGSYPISRISTALIEEWVATSGVGVPTKRKAVVLLGQMFKFAAKRGYVRINPVALVDKPKLPNPDPVTPPTPARVEEIRKAFFDAGKPLEATLCSVIAYAGTRPLSEALKLTRGDVRDRTLLVRAPKTNTYRAVDLLPPLAEDLRWWMGQSLAFNSAPLFPNRNGGFWSQTTYDNWRKRTWDEVVPDLPPKDLRHSFVSLLIRDENYSRREVADQAGHSLEVQDRVYSHVWAELRGTGSAEGAIRHARGEITGRAGTEEREVGL